MKDVNAYRKKQSDRYKQVMSFEDIEKAKKAGKLAIMHNFQSMRPLAEDIGNVEKFYKLGLRQMNFTCNVDLPKIADGGDSNFDGTGEGVYELEFDIIKEMNRLGIVLDCSHSSNNTCIEMAMASSKPLIMSNSQMTTFQPVEHKSGFSDNVKLGGPASVSSQLEEDDEVKEPAYVFPGVAAFLQAWSDFELIWHGLSDYIKTNVI